MKNSFNGRDFRLVTALAIVSLAAACGEKPKAPPPQPPEVGVYAAKTTPVPVVVELPGRVSAFLAAPIIARVDGIVLHRDFVEGSEVKAGQRLYQIDPAPYEATLESAKATLAKAQAAVVSAKAQADRYKILVAANAVSKQDYDNAVAAEGQDVADVAAGKASVKTAQINLGYTNIVSPITGRVGKSTVTPGAYVQANGAAPLATVQQLEPVYVDLTQSSLDGLKLRREIEAGRLTEGGPNAAKITLVLEDGKPYEAAGKLEFSDITVDQTTGSVTVRATFPNPKRVLLPGMFVHAQIEEGTNENAIVVPQVSVTHDQKGNPTEIGPGHLPQPQARFVARHVRARANRGGHQRKRHRGPASERDARPKGQSDRDRSGPPSPTPSAFCCPACSCTRKSRRAPTKTPSWSRK